MSLNLYGIENAIQDCMELVETAQSAEEKKAAQDALVLYVSQEIDKVDNIRAFLKHCVRMATAARDEAKFQTERALAWEAREERLKDLVKYAMIQRDYRRREGKTGTLRVQVNSSRKLKITDETLIPAEFWRTETIRHLETAKLKAALERGPVAGAHLEERGEHLRVI